MTRLLAPLAAVFLLGLSAGAADAPKKPNVVLVTDGPDDVSKTTLDAARAAVVSSAASFMAIDLDHAGGADQEAVGSIMDRTGGSTFTASKGETTKAFETLAATLKAQYVATYHSRYTQGQVDVTLGVGNLEIGYAAPECPPDDPDPMPPPPPAGDPPVIL